MNHSDQQIITLDKTRIDKTNKLKKNLSVSVFLDHFRQSHKVSPKSLVSSIFGDLIVPNGGRAWVKTLSSLLEPLGINNRLVRTTLFRLAEEGWLDGTREGRRSFYELTEKAASQTKVAEKLIYYADQKDWDGEWTLVFIVMKPIEMEARRQLEQELTWIGFGAITKHILAHPTVTPELVADRVCSLGLQSSVVCMRARNLSGSNIGLKVRDQDMAIQCFPLKDLENQYQDFIDTFSHVDSKLIANEPSYSMELLALRLLLVDQYRRIVLHDPHLPSKLLPNDWIGEKAYEVFKNLYIELYELTEATYRKSASDAGDSLLTEYDQSYVNRLVD